MGFLLCSSFASGMRFVIKSYNSVNKPLSNVSSNKLLSKFIIYTLQQFDFSQVQRLTLCCWDSLKKEGHASLYASEVTLYESHRHMLLPLFK